jgi:hypothetical protein
MTVLLLVTLLATAGLPPASSPLPAAGPAKAPAADPQGGLGALGSLDSLAAPGAFKGNLFAGFS